LKLVQIVDDDLSDFTHTMGSINAFANPNEGGNNNNGQATLTNKLQITQSEQNRSTRTMEVNKKDNNGGVSVGPLETTLNGSNI